MSLKPIDPKTLELNPFTTIGTEWMLLTAGNEDDRQLGRIGRAVEKKCHLRFGTSTALYYGIYGP